MSVVNLNSGTNDVILATTGGSTNYRLALELSDTDLSTGASSSLGLGQIAPTTFPGTELTNALASGATATWTGVTASMGMSDAICPSVSHLCAVLYRGTTEDYEDASAAADRVNLSPNTTCLALTTTNKQCRTGNVITANSELYHVNIFNTLFRTLVRNLKYRMKYFFQ